MYVVAEIDSMGTLELAVFDTVQEAERLIRKLSFGGVNKYKVLVRSPLQYK